MKTADLIPFILLELNESDKYGFELTKSIETKSNGKIIIKQPTLYTLLKKLEKSKFIASYWEDSEIGGKRHYYKLTQNGRLQLSTLPSYSFLLNNLIHENGDVVESSNLEQNEPTTESDPQKVSIMDELLPTTPTLSETPLPAEEVFSETHLDSSTELELNVANTEILKEDKTAIDEEFANSENVSKFTQKVETTPQILVDPIEEHNPHSILDLHHNSPMNSEIKFVDYVNFKNTENYKYSKAVSSKLLLTSLATSLSLILITIICAIITSFTGRSGLFYTFFIASILFAIFYPICTLVNKDKIRLKYQKQTFTTKTKLSFYIALSALLVVFIICIIVNIKINNNTIKLILNFSNFENFYAPLLLSSVFFIDILFEHLFLSKLNKQE